MLRTLAGLASFPVLRSNHDPRFQASRRARGDHTVIRFRGLVQLAALAAITGCASTQAESPPPPASPSATTVATASSARLPPTGPVEPGTYHVASSAWSVAGFKVTMPEGWETQYGYTFIKHSDQLGELGFYFVIVDAIYSDPCEGGGELNRGRPRRR